MRSFPPDVVLPEELDLSSAPGDEPPHALPEVSVPEGIQQGVHGRVEDPDTVVDHL